MSNYSKFKDRSPQETIRTIQEILGRAGIFTTVNSGISQYSGAFSNRVSIYPTDLGTNGKGTDELYACASGYAELMERMQNNLLALRMPRPRVSAHGEFREFPDEKVMSISELLEQNDPFFGHIFESLGYSDPFRKQHFISRMASLFEHRRDGMITCVPYADLSGDRIVYLPDYIVINVFGSNGMAAGNTIEEAMVQGMCEIYERYANTIVLKGEDVPPVIPSDELDKYSFSSLIDEIESDGRYRISVRDCSLGRGLPVVASVISDTETGRFGIKFGSHPSMPVAVERTLTEAFQGRNLEAITGSCSFGSGDQAVSYHNIPNIMKIGVGTYPAGLLSGRSEREYRPWTEWEGLDNQGFLSKMLGMAERDGLHILVRDNSHMGFPAVQIIVPGYSDMYQVCGTWERGLSTGARAAEAIGHFPDLTEGEEISLLRMIQFKEYSFFENSIQAISMRPFRDKALSSDRIAAFIALKREDFETAAHFLKKLLMHGREDGDAVYYNALSNYCRGRLCGLDSEAAVNLVSELFREDTASRVKEEVSDPEGILRRNFPSIRCFDCDSCTLRGEGCSNAAEEEVLIRIKDAMKDSRVSQDELLKRLTALMQEGTDE